MNFTQVGLMFFHMTHGLGSIIEWRELNVISRGLSTMMLDYSSFDKIVYC